MTMNRPRGVGSRRESFDHKKCCTPCGQGSRMSNINSKGHYMSQIMTKDGVEIFYKDWGEGQPIVFSHGWPLSADDWDGEDADQSGRSFQGCI
jgi:hypothetical protein